MEITKLFAGAYRNKKVFITGHTGFKGTWLTFWLTQMGAEVIGLSSLRVSEPVLYDTLNIDHENLEGDVRDIDKLIQIFNQTKPDIIFHLAAQALVQPSYKEPSATFEVNVMGTLNILEALRKSGISTKVVIVTSDKVYQNNEWVWGYRENDPLGGYDPYSASKACAEIVTNSYRKSFFNDNHQVLVSSARAGNVVGGGDWAMNRLVPDIIRAITTKETLRIRNPHATRPWQHVLEPLSGYLLLGMNLLSNETDFCEAWNFGPLYDNIVPVQHVVEESKKHWNELEYAFDTSRQFKHEANLLSLDCSKSTHRMKWKPIWDFDTTIKRTILWYKGYYEGHDAKNLCLSDLENYINSASAINATWLG